MIVTRTWACFFVVSGVACAPPSATRSRSQNGARVAAIVSPDAVPVESAHQVNVVNAKPPLTNVAQVAAGTGHACALLRSGEVRCWGDNVSGQLGDGTKETRATPIQVRALPNTIAVAAGDDFSCALSREGKVTCWGGETPDHFQEELSPADQKRLGEIACARGEKTLCDRAKWYKRMNSTINSMPKQPTLPKHDIGRPPPGAPIPNLNNVVEIAAGGTQVCTRNAAAEVWCMSIASPHSRMMYFVDLRGHWKAKRIAKLQRATHIAANETIACAVLQSGQVACWNGIEAPKLVVGVDDAIAIATGRMHACVLRKGGGVSCWGYGSQGQTGGQQASIDSIVNVNNIDNAIAIAAGGNSTCAVRSNGAVTCWGEVAYLGEAESAEVRDVAGIEGAQAIAIGERFACATTGAGALRCWGLQSRGRLGRGTMPETLSASNVVGLTDAVDVRAASHSSCAQKKDGSVACWGQGYRAPAQTPFVTVSGVRDVISLGSTSDTFCAATHEGRASCWRAGDETRSMAGVNDAIAVRPHASGVCIVRKGGQVACGYWHSAVADIPGIGGAVDVQVAASDYACARKRDGNVACWTTALSLSSTLGPTTLAPVPLFGDVIDMAAKGLGASVVRKSGVVESWGTLRASPVAMPEVDITDAVAISKSASEVWECVLRQGGGVACRGAENNRGERGDGALGLRGPLFTSVVGIGDATKLSAGYGHVCVVRKSGEVACWGDDSYGQVTGRDGGPYQKPADVLGL